MNITSQLTPTELISILFSFLSVVFCLVTMVSVLSTKDDIRNIKQPEDKYNIEKVRCSNLIQKKHINNGEYLEFAKSELIEGLVRGLIKKEIVTFYTINSPENDLNIDYVELWCELFLAIPKSKNNMK